MSHASRDARRIDARGSLCPVPTVKASLALEAAPPGGLVELTADDPVTRRDLPAWCRSLGHEIVEVTEAGSDFTILIRKKG